MSWRFLNVQGWEKNVGCKMAYMSRLEVHVAIHINCDGLQRKHVWTMKRLLWLSTCAETQGRVEKEKYSMS